MYKVHDNNICDLINNKEIDKFVLWLHPSMPMLEKPDVLQYSLFSLHSPASI